MKILKAFFICSLSAFMIWSCNSPAPGSEKQNPQAEVKDSSGGTEYTHDHLDKKDSIATNETEIATLFLVIADTGNTYQLLLEKMVALKSEYGLTIDSMDRYYDRKKNKIILPANHEDEMYAGQYFPRRFPSEDLSIEYLKTYKAGAGENTMAIVAGIYEKEKMADNTLNKIKQSDKNAFKLKAEIYMGCAH